MEIDRAVAAQIAQGYFRTNKPLVSLGWGISGFVFLSPDSRAAAKVRRHEESFLNELAVYRHNVEFITWTSGRAI